MSLENKRQHPVGLSVYWIPWVSDDLDKKAHLTLLFRALKIWKLSPHLTVGHISCATVTCDYRNICKIPHAELNWVIVLGSWRADCNPTLFQLRCGISAVLSQIPDLMNGWCWITSKVRREFTLHAWDSLNLCFRAGCVGCQHITVQRANKVLICVAHLFELTWSCFRGWRGI